MKKVLSLVMAVIMAFATLAPVSAFAWGENAYDYYIISSGKKGGEILGSYEIVRLNISKYNLQGYDEVLALNNQSEEKYRAAFNAEKAALYAYVEVEKAKIEAAGICAESSEEFGTGLMEGFGSAFGDPSACARNIDIIVADCEAVQLDAELALEKYNRAISGNFEEPDTYDSLMKDSINTAGRAFQEYADAEVTYYKNSLIFDDSWDYVVAQNEPLFELRERALKLVEKADSEVRKNRECLDKAREYMTAARDLAASAYEKAAVLYDNAAPEDKPHCEEIKYNLWYLGAETDSHGTPNSELSWAIGYIDRMQPAVFDVDLSGCVGMVDRLTSYPLFELRKTVESVLLSKWFLTANELTYNGKEQPLVTLGSNVYLPDGEQVKFALGSAPDNVFDEVVYYDFHRKTYAPGDSEFTEKIPEAKEPGTYYVYAKFSDSINIAAKVVINEAKPAPDEPAVPEKKANTLTAKGRTVRVKKNKKTVIKKAKAFTIKNAKGKVTFKKTKGSKKISVAKSGKITVKKGLKAGTYKVKITVTASGNADYKKGSKTVTVKIVVK